MTMYPQVKRVYEFCYVWLRRNTESAHFFYCPQCQNPIMRYQGQVASIIPAGGNAMGADINAVMSFPLEEKCSNHNCPAKYIFEGMVV